MSIRDSSNNASVHFCKRQRQMIMHLVAYLDDSGSDGQNNYFVLAGYIATPDVWEEFSEKWRSTLDVEPKIGCFKMTEAMGMRNRFSPSKGWTREKINERVEALTEIISETDVIQVSSYINWSDYRSVIKRIPKAEASDDLVHRSPYSLALHRLITDFFLFNVHHSQDIRCDWIFDYQSASEMRFAKKAWLTSKAIIDLEMPQFAKNFAAPPVYKDDKDEPPLQAADLLAWSTRRVLERDTLKGKVPDKALDNLLIPRAITRRWGLEDLENAFHLLAK